jgi:hypothetical protein
MTTHLQSVGEDGLQTYTRKPAVNPGDAAVDKAWFYLHD